MAATPPSKVGSSPPKPWERAAAQSDAAPFEPSSAGSTSDVVEASGNAKAGEIVPVDNSRPANRNSAGGLASRPWERNIGNNLGVYNSGSNPSTTFGSGPYGSALGYGGTYGGSLYANSPYGGYSGSYGGYGSYGGPYGGSFGGQFGNYGMGMGAPYSNLGPNGPFGQPASPPGFWMSFLNMTGTLVQTFSRIAMIVNENTHALHILVTALLQVFGHSGRLYGELAPFVLRILGFKSTAKRVLPQERSALPGAAEGGKLVDGPKVASAGWDTYWGK